MKKKQFQNYNVTETEVGDRLGNPIHHSLYAFGKHFEVKHQRNNTSFRSDKVCTSTYVHTNHLKINGASVLFFPSFIRPSVDIIVILS